MSSKATPLEHLPQAANSGNVQMQMQMAPDQTSGNPMPPQPHMGQTQQMQAGNQMHQEMGMDQERQRMDSQDNYMSRQFVPQTRMGNQPGPPQGTYDGQQFPDQYQDQQMPVSIPRGSSKMRGGKVIDASEMGIVQLLMSQSKMLSILFALLLCIQLETTQGLFRKLTRMVKVPDSMVFTASKVLAALVCVVVFFFVFRNL